MEMTSVRAVLLDMDGTLVDSDAAVERAWSTWSAEHGLDPASVIAIAHGSPPGPTVRRLLPELDDGAVAASAQRQMDLQYDDVADVVAAPGAPELLAALDRLGLPWAVVTSADVRLAKARLGAAGIEPPLLALPAGGAPRVSAAQLHAGRTGEQPEHNPERGLPAGTPSEKLDPPIPPTYPRREALVTVEDVRRGKPDPEGFRIAAARLGVDPAACLVVEDSEPGLASGRAAGMRTAALRGLDGDLRIADLAQLARLLDPCA
ncbi:HAD-IA family hydrolase [Pseudonocardia sp. DLS-67]